MAAPGFVFHETYRRWYKDFCSDQDGKWYRQYDHESGPCVPVAPPQRFDAPSSTVYTEGAHGLNHDSVPRSLASQQLSQPSYQTRPSAPARNHSSDTRVTPLAQIAPDNNNGLGSQGQDVSSLEASNEVTRSKVNEENYVVTVGTRRGNDRGRTRPDPQYIKKRRDSESQGRIDQGNSPSTIYRTVSRPEQGYEDKTQRRPSQTNQPRPTVQTRKSSFSRSSKSKIDVVQRQLENVNLSHSIESDDEVEGAGPSQADATVSPTLAISPTPYGGEVTEPQQTSNLPPVRLAPQEVPSSQTSYFAPQEFGSTAPAFGSTVLMPSQPQGYQTSYPASAVQTRGPTTYGGYQSTIPASQDPTELTPTPEGHQSVNPSTPRQHTSPPHYGTTQSQFGRVSTMNPSSPSMYTAAPQHGSTQSPFGVSSLYGALSAPNPVSTAQYDVPLRHPAASPILAASPLSETKQQDVSVDDVTSQADDGGLGGAGYRIKATGGQEERLDGRYKRRDDAKRFFKVGRVFALLWHEGVGSEGTVLSQPYMQRPPGYSKGPYQQDIYSTIRRMIVVKEGKGYSWCLPISTYGRRGTTKPGLNPESHAIVYMSDTNPARLKLETGMTKEPLAVDPSPGQKLESTSRVNFDKVYTVEHNVKVMSVGKISDRSMPKLTGYWAYHRG